jgi:hypothetical protein
MSYDFRVILFFDERKNQAQRKYPVAKRGVGSALSKSRFCRSEGGKSEKVFEPYGTQ